MKTPSAGKNLRQPVEGWPAIDDLSVFVTVARNGGFARAAQELGLSPSTISKRIAMLEKQLDIRLFFRNNRSMRLTAEGEIALEGAMQIVSGVGDFVSDLNGLRGAVTGNITLSCSFGFGHEYMADALSGLMNLHNGLNVKLMLSDREVNLVDEGIDIEIHVGDEIKDLYIARQLAANRRILCASPDYLRQAGVPTSLDDLRQHDCLIIQERSAAFGNWALTNGEDAYCLPGQQSAFVQQRQRGAGLGAARTRDCAAIGVGRGEASGQRRAGADPASVVSAGEYLGGLYPTFLPLTAD